jgi:cysteine desulfurase
VQALGQLPIDLSDLGADAVTISSHKIGGPFGVGALIADPRAQLTPVLHGGGQEREVRSGTVDAPAIAGFAVAVEHAVSTQVERAAQLTVLRDALVAGILEVVPDARINGDVEPGLGHRLPGNVHASFPGCEGDLLLMLLDAAGVDCSTGSACTAGIPEPSHVLLAMGVDPAMSRASLRFSLGESSTAEDIDAVVAALPGAVARARRAGSLATQAG